MSSSGPRQLENIFVTVGSTQFDHLIDALVDRQTLQIFKNLGCQKLTIQYGGYKQTAHLEFLQSWTDFETELFDYKSSIDEYIDSADLVIGHAGAGTVLEVLRKGKPLLIVINDRLMDNHQEELARDLANQQFVVCSYPSQMCQILQSLDVTSLRPFPKHDPTKFSSFITRLLQTNK